MSEKTPPKDTTELVFCKHVLTDKEGRPVLQTFWGEKILVTNLRTNQLQEPEE